MQLLYDKLKETMTSVLPIVVIVFLLSLFMVDIPGDMMIRFIIGAVCLILGLTIFLLGIDVGMTPIGEKMGESIVKSSSIKFILFLTFLIGFSVTVAEPDLAVLGEQIAEATGGMLSAGLIISVVGIGVGAMISMGMIRILKGIPLKYFYTATYGLIFVICLLASTDFIAMGFDSSGSTTGAMTTPFILTIGASASALKSGESSEKDSFGLVGAMSTGPIIAVMLMSLFVATDLSGTGATYEYTQGIFEPYINSFGPTILETLLSLAPIMLIFWVMNHFYFHTEKEDLGDILKGIAYTFIGLVLFLTGVNQGFFDMGHYLGEQLSEGFENWLPVVSAVLGFVAVLAEPAVHVLGNQVEEITGGFINQKLLIGTFCLSVGVAGALAMLKIMIPALELWHFVLAFFGLSLILTYFVDDLFTGIAFDAGGVASGPMTATFILAFSQGVAEYLPQADAVRDGFGIIAMVAMVPITMVLLLGLIFTINMKKDEQAKNETEAE